MHHGWCEFLGEDLDGRCWDLGTWGPRLSSLRSLWLVVGHFNDLNARFCKNLPLQKVVIHQNHQSSIANVLGCSNKKRTFSEMLFGSIGLLQKA